MLFSSDYQFLLCQLVLIVLLCSTFKKTYRFSFQLSFSQPCNGHFMPHFLSLSLYTYSCFSSHPFYPHTFLECWIWNRVFIVFCNIWYIQHSPMTVSALLFWFHHVLNPSTCVNFFSLYIYAYIYIYIYMCVCVCVCVSHLTQLFLVQDASFPWDIRRKLPYSAKLIPDFFGWGLN